ncbi:DctP family TRAP transporter solute-binding subunit [bacterium]|nr:DctP family TRAP transporter solute-binding subunit [bacterium]
MFEKPDQKTILLILSIFCGIFLIWLLFSEQNILRRFKSNSENSGENKIHIRIAHDLPQGTPLHQATLQIAELLKNELGARVKVEIFPNQTAGTDEHMIERALVGELDLIFPPTAKLAQLYPPIQYADLPFVFESREDAYRVLDGELGERLRAGLQQKGLQCFRHWESGFKQFTAKKPIRDPRDLVGLRVRTMRSPMIMEQFKMWGAIPILIDFQQIYKAMADNAIDAGENSIVAIAALNLADVQKVMTISNHGYLSEFPCLSEKSLWSSDKELNALLKRVVDEVAEKQRHEALRVEQMLLAELEAGGLRVERLTEQERKNFVASVKDFSAGMIAKWEKEFSLKIPVKSEPKAKDEIELKQEPNDREVVIGIDADLSLAASLAGQAIQHGAHLAAEELNERGGVLGRKVEIESYDNAGINLRGLANIKKLAEQKNLIAILGGIHSNVILSEIDSIHRYKIPFLVPWASAVDIVENGQKPNYVFRLGGNDEQVAKFLVKNALQRSKKIALLMESSVWGRSSQKAIERVLAENHVKPVMVQWVDRGANEVSIQIASLQSSAADIVLMTLNAPEGILAVKSMAERGVRFQVLSHWGITSNDFYKETSDALKKVKVEFIQAFTFFRNANPRARSLFERYQIASSQMNLKATQLSAAMGLVHAYDLTKMIAQATINAGRLDRTLIREQLEKLFNFSAINKIHNPPFTAQRHDALDPSAYFLAHFNNRGEILPTEDGSK